MPSSPNDVRVYQIIPTRVHLELSAPGAGRSQNCFYAWLLESLSPRAVENQALSVQIKEFYNQSMCIYGRPRIFCDFREAGVQCSENLVARLIRMLKSSLRAATKGHVTRWRSLTGLVQPVAAPVPARRGRSSLGDRYHLHSHV